MKILLLYTFEDYLILAYSFMAAIAAFGYGPQIWTLVKSTGRSMSTPISTWLLWATEACVSFTYAVIVLRDPVTMCVFGIDFLAAFTILSLTIYNRYYRFSPSRPQARSIAQSIATVKDNVLQSSRHSINLRTQSQTSS